jgi:MerC mercury resistance protein
MRPDGKRFSWLPGLATALSLLACYGTLAVLALLGALGVAIALDEALWAGAIVTTAALAVGGLAIGTARHRQVWPLLVGALGAAVIGYAMYAQYSRITEVSGFVLLSAATFWDWRLRRTC